MSQLNVNTIQHTDTDKPPALTLGFVWNMMHSFDQTGTQSTYTSLNVASITDSGTGRTTSTYTTAFSAADTNYYTTDHERGAAGDEIAKTRDPAVGSHLTLTDVAGTDTDRSYVWTCVEGDLT